MLITRKSLYGVAIDHIAYSFGGILEDKKKRFMQKRVSRAEGDYGKLLLIEYHLRTGEKLLLAKG